MSRAWFKTLAGLLLASILLAACGTGPGKPKEMDTVRFTEVIHSIFYAPQYVAEAKGFFADEQIELIASTAQGSDKGVAAVLAGTADIAMVGPETTVFVHNQDSPVKVVIFAQITARDGSFLVARQKPQRQFNWADLKGKTVVGWRPGSMPQLVAAGILRRHGLNPEADLNYINNIAAPAMMGAFLSGTQEYIQVFEPLVSQLEKDGQGHVVSYLGKDYGPIPYTGFVATDKFIAANPDLVQRYTNAIYRAQRYLFETDSTVVAREVAPFFEGTDIDLLASAIRRYRDEGGWTKTPVMDPVGFEQLQDLMIEGGVLDSAHRAPFDKIANNRFAETAVQRIK